MSLIHRRSAARPKRSLPPSTVFVLLAVGTVVLTRLPFLLANPDWGPVLTSEHCFLQSAPVVYAHRQALSPDSHVPFWLVNPGQIKLHFHAGSGVIHYLVWYLYRLFPSASLASLKLIGTTFLAVYTAMLTWALVTLWPREPIRAAAAVFMVCFPPTVFLWFTLLPEGHYTETHLAYGLVLPYMVLGARGHVTPALRMITGAVVGVASGYALSNAVLFFAFLVFRLWAGNDAPDHRRFDWLRHSLTLSVSAAAAFLLTGRGSSLLFRLGGALLGPPAETAADMGHLESVAAWIRVVAVSVSEQVPVLFAVGVHGPGRQPHAIFTAGTILWVLVSVAVGASLLKQLVLVGRLFSGSERGEGSEASRRFMAINGLLLLGFVCFFLAFEPDAGQSFLYLSPIFPVLITGAGGLAATSIRQRRQVVRVPLVLVWAALGFILIAGWLDNWHANSSRDDLPDLEGCASRFLDGYFWSLDPGDGGWQLPTLRTDGWGRVVYDPVAGVRKCAASLPGDEEICAYHGFIRRHNGADVWLECDEFDPRERHLCAQAYGAVHAVCREGVLRCTPRVAARCM